MTNSGREPEASQQANSSRSLTLDELTEITRYLLRFSPDVLIVIDAAGQICFANETTTELLGYAPDALIGRSIEVLIPARFRSRHAQHIATYIRSPCNREMGSRIVDLFTLRADGSEFPAGIRLAPFHIGGRLFVAAAIRDVTEGHLINEELVAARSEAERANRAKSRFLATASHDLRQPMQTIRLLNAAMLRAVSQPELRNLLQQQSQAIDGMARLLNALLDISKLESGAIEPIVADVPLRKTFADLRAEFASLASLRGIELHIDDPAIVLATDRTLFAQVLQNLLGNALKYTDRGSVSLKCETGPAGLVIAIEDTGIGIPADKLERIFDEYYQVDTHGTKRAGVGLGLAIVREVTRLLGFSISISSIVGSGTIARLCIPDRYLAEAGVEVPVESAVAVSHRPRRQARIFLVEDNDGVRIATETFLRLEGHEVQSATTVAEADAMFCSFRRGDLVIADYHLDGGNTGLDMLQALRQRLAYDVPAIILSGDLPSVLRPMKSPVVRCKFLSKPVDTADLIRAIAELEDVAGHRASVVL